MFVSDHAATASSVYTQALSIISSVEPRIGDAIGAELADQRASLKLIASENYASLATLLTMGNWLSDKYAEGTDRTPLLRRLPERRHRRVGGRRARPRLFGAEYAYVQPHSGIDANLVAYWAILNKRIESPALARLGAKNVNDLTEADWEELRREFNDQRVMGMSLDAGGHLTHGFRHNISGKMFAPALLRHRPRDRAHRLRRAARRRPASSSRSSWWPATPPTRGG
jgi:glycine hydroxymethyltransferase